MKSHGHKKPIDFTVLKITISMVTSTTRMVSGSMISEIENALCYTVLTHSYTYTVIQI